jgi:hypothetical protein
MKKIKQIDIISMYSVVNHILFIVVCSCIWWIAHLVIQMFPDWSLGTPMFVGWMSHVVYNKIFS